MSSIEHVSTAQIALNSEECKALNGISATKIGEIGDRVLVRMKGDCELSTWCHYNAGSAADSGLDEYPCEMQLSVTESAVDEQTLLFKCAKALCRGEDAPTSAAERVELRVNEAVKAFQNLKKL